MTCPRNARAIAAAEEQAAAFICEIRAMARQSMSCSFLEARSEPGSLAVCAAWGQHLLPGQSCATDVVSDLMVGLSASFRLRISTWRSIQVVILVEDKHLAFDKS